MSAIIPCIFGTTKGFELVPLAPLPFKMQDLLVAITHGEVELSLDDACIKILRVKSGAEAYTWIGLYRKAYEMGFSREGGYYGAGIWLSDTTVDARHVIDALEDLAFQISKLALVDRKFQRTLSEIEAQLVASPSLSALVNSKAPYGKGGISADAKICAFISQPQSAREIVTWAQSDALAQHFQSVIIAPPNAFPKAGASGNIKLFQDITALERALERDYAARLAKSDGLNKDLQKRMQSLEAELAQRRTDNQSLSQKNVQLEGLLARSKMMTAQRRGGPIGYAYGEEERELSLGHPFLVAPVGLGLGVILTILVFTLLVVPDRIDVALRPYKDQRELDLKEITTLRIQADELRKEISEEQQRNAKLQAMIRVAQRQAEPQEETGASSSSSHNTPSNGSASVGSDTGEPRDPSNVPGSNPAAATASNDVTITPQPGPAPGGPSTGSQPDTSGDVSQSQDQPTLEAGTPSESEQINAKLQTKLKKFILLQFEKNEWLDREVLIGKTFEEKTLLANDIDEILDELSQSQFLKKQFPKYLITKAGLDYRKSADN